MGGNKLNKDYQGQQSKNSQFSSNHFQPQEASDSQINDSNIDAKNDNFGVISSPETSSGDATEKMPQNSLSNEHLSLEMPVMLHVSSSVINTTVGFQPSDNSNLVTQNVTGSHQTDELKTENLPTFRATQKKMKDDEQKSLGRKDGEWKQTRFSKTTLMMLVLTLTTFVLFVPHLIIQ